MVDNVPATGKEGLKTAEINDSWIGSLIDKI
jgi:hypothetical protein